MRVVVFGALNGAFAIGLGAFGAHILGGQIQSANPEAFQTAVEYQLLHAAVLVALGALRGHVLPFLLHTASWLLGIGIVLFSGSLYAMSMGAPEWMAMVTPVGGGMLILGWLVTAVAGARRI